jgi:hypothetical protein
MQELETIIRKLVADEVEKVAAPLRQELATTKSILSKISTRVGTKEALALTGIKSEKTLKKTFTPLQHGEKGRLTYSRVELETWIANKELTKAA